MLVALEAVVDNDVLIKGACYAIIAELGEGLGGADRVGVLGAARFVVDDRLTRQPGIQDRQHARDRWLAFLMEAEELEPTDAEIDLATAIEEVAAVEGSALDGGESQLCAMAIMRKVSRVLTGDKRAIHGLESIVGAVDRLAELSGRLVCLEQLMMAVVKLIGAAQTRSRVCAEPYVDRAISICFECTHVEVQQEFGPVGLESYIGDLRANAGTVLMEGLALFT